MAGDCAKIDLYVPRNSKLFVLIEAKAPWQKILDRFETVASTYFNMSREDYELTTYYIVARKYEMNCRVVGVHSVDFLLLNTIFCGVLLNLLTYMGVFLFAFVTPLC